ncbi:SpoIIE family protein phosphatase [Streptacidiphilus cavernicola]|uniref:SpoIIE family protein phosphatase n=1 Tax=Streptacidiphilus cavernicola TaxID=3342716 RepID=A0ABV6VPS4_9ACTN
MGLADEHDDLALPLRAGDVLSAAGIGVWRWNREAGALELDPACARLLGLDDTVALLPERRLRSLLHAEDFIRLRSTAALAVSERRPFELRVRVLTEQERLLRVLHLQVAVGPPRSGYQLQGTALDGGTAGAGAEGGGTEGGGGPLATERRQIDALNQGVHPPDPGRPAPPDPGRPYPADPAPRHLRRSREAFLLDAGRALAEAGTTSEVLRVVASLSMPGFSPDGLAVFGSEGGMLTVVGQHGHQKGAEQSFTMPLETDYPAAEVVRTGRAVYLSSPEEYQHRFPATWPLATGFGRRSWAFLPLVTAGRTTGAWLASFRTPVRFSPDERAVLSTVARMLAHALERAHTNESERALSRGLRRSMGTGAPAAPGISVATRYVPTGGGLMVGGDWYDIIDLPEGRMALVIGDVQGHDVHAAGLMAQLRTAVHAYAAEGHRPDAVLARTSRFLAALDEDRFATCVYIEADPARGTLQIARAGHPHPVIRTPDGTCLIRHVEGGLPLGLMPDEEDYPVTTMELQSGEVMLLCTDGLIETGGHDMYSGWVRVRDTMSPGPADDLEGMADALIRAVHGPASHEGPGHLADRREDDIALLLLRRDSVDQLPEPPGRRLVLTVAQDQPERISGARQELRAIMHDWAAPEQVDAAVLLASELLANVLVHTETEAALVASMSGPAGFRQLRIEVADRSDELAHRRSPGEMASSGRGLILLDLLSDRWGMQPRGEGKAIWFDLDEAPGD